MTTMTRINVTQAADMLEAMKAANDGAIFSVVFIKRTTGEKRTMQCRFNVTSHLKGGEQSFNPAERGLITVYDMVKCGYRMINLCSILTLTIKGETFEIEDNVA